MWWSLSQSICFSTFSLAACPRHVIDERLVLQPSPINATMETTLDQESDFHLHARRMDVELLQCSTKLRRQRRFELSCSAEAKVGQT